MGQAVAGVPDGGKGGTLQVKCVRLRLKAVAKQVLKLLMNDFKVKKRAKYLFLSLILKFYSCRCLAPRMPINTAYTTIE